MQTYTLAQAMANGADRAAPPIDTTDIVSVTLAYLRGRLSWEEYRAYERQIMGDIDREGRMDGTDRRDGRAP